MNKPQPEGMGLMNGRPFGAFGVWVGAGTQDIGDGLEIL